MTWDLKPARSVRRLTHRHGMQQKVLNTDQVGLAGLLGMGIGIFIFVSHTAVEFQIQSTTLPSNFNLLSFFSHIPPLKPSSRLAEQIS